MNALNDTEVRTIRTAYRGGQAAHDHGSRRTPHREGGETAGLVSTIMRRIENSSDAASKSRAASGLVIARHIEPEIQQTQPAHQLVSTCARRKSLATVADQTEKFDHVVPKLFDRVAWKAGTEHGALHVPSASSAQS